VRAMSSLPSIDGMEWLLIPFEVVVSSMACGCCLSHLGRWMRVLHFGDFDGLARVRRLLN